MEKKPLCNFVGPFIGIRNKSYQIILVQPLAKHLSQINCIFVCEENEIEVKGHRSDPIYGKFVFEVPDEFPKGKVVSYYFKEDGVIIEDLDGLKKSDLWFRNISVNEIKKTALLSCNNPFHFKEKKSKRFNMWERLNKQTHLAKTELIILAGDQLYNDNLERFLKPKVVDVDSLRRAFIKNYLVYFGIAERKKVMARIPSVAIWDDHDITDGFGSRPEQFKNGNLKSNWKEFYSIAAEAFEVFQASRNPKNKFSNSYSNYVDLKNTRIYLFDFRSNRDVTKKQLFHPNDMKDFSDSLKGLPSHIKNVSIVSPVIIARSTTNFDLITRTVAKGTYYLKSLLLNTIGKLGRMDSVIKKTFSKLMIADLCDDLDDSLGSSKNRNEFKKILNELLPYLKRDITLQFLSGDIHTGGESTLSIKSDNETFFVPVIVSSPIGYEPMSPVVEKVTTSNDEIGLIKDDIIVSQRNGEFISERNFALLDYLNFRLVKNHHFEFDKTVYRKEYYINSGTTKHVEQSVSRERRKPSENRV